MSDTTKFGNYAVHAKFETLGQDKLWLILGGCRPVFLKRRAAARYRALASIIKGRERFSWN